MKTKTFFISVEDGKFRLSCNDKVVGDAYMNAESLAVLFTHAGVNQNSQMLCSSSIDFPEDDGGPAGFDCRACISKALQQNRVFLAPPLSSPTAAQPSPYEVCAFYITRKTDLAVELTGLINTYHAKRMALVSHMIHGDLCVVTFRKQ